MTVGYAVCEIGETQYMFNRLRKLQGGIGRSLRTGLKELEKENPRL